MDYEELLRQYLGEFGRYQRFSAVLVVLIAPFFGAVMVATTFLAATPEHHCRLFDNNSLAMRNYSAKILNSSVPMEKVDGLWVHSSCMTYNGTGGAWKEKQTVASCRYGWEYDQSVYRSTIVTEYDFVCERHWLKELGQSIFMMGVSAGGLISGTISDRFGRRPTIVVCIMLQLSSGVAAAFTEDYISFLVFRLISGGAANGLFVVGFALGIEAISTSKRSAVGITIASSVTVGYVIFGALAYVLRRWWTLQLAVALMSLPFLSYWWLLPESPRWLISNGRTEEAKASLKRAAEVNKVTITDEVYEKVTNPKKSEPSESKQYSLIDLFRGRRLRMITITMSSVWFVTVAVYYALIIGSADLAGDPYLNFILGALLELGLSLIGWGAMERWGRRPVVGGSLLLTGIACLETAATPSASQFSCKADVFFADPNKPATTALQMSYDESTIQWSSTEIVLLRRVFLREGSLSMIPNCDQVLQSVVQGLTLFDRCGIGVAFTTLAVYSPEVFPTVVRTMGLGVANMCSRVGGILSPLVSLLADVSRPIPMLTFGIMCTVGSAEIFHLPETFGIPLPDTLEDAESLRRNQLKGNDRVTEIVTVEPDRDLIYMEPVVISGHVLWDNDYFYYNP